MKVETERRSNALGIDGSGFAGDKGRTAERFGTLEVRIVGVRVAPSTIRVGGANTLTPVRIEVELDAPTPIEEPILGVSLHRVSDFVKVLDVSTESDGVSLGRLHGKRTVALHSTTSMLNRARTASTSVCTSVTGVVYDYHWHAYPLEIVSTGGVGFGPPRQWHDL